MRLGRDTNSLTNWTLSGTNGAPTPTVGMGVTRLKWTDRTGGLVTWVSRSGKTIRFVDTEPILEPGSYYSGGTVIGWEPPAPDAPEYTARLTKNGWTCKGETLRVGERLYYRDPSF
jgi:hypothetical protein